MEITLKNRKDKEIHLQHNQTERWDKVDTIILVLVLLSSSFVWFFDFYFPYFKRLLDKIF